MNNKTLIWLLFIFLSLTWGSSFILMKKSMFPTGHEMVLGPFQVGALRIVIAGTVLLPIALKFKKHLTRKTFHLLFIVGFFGSLMPSMMFTLAETGISSSMAGLVNMATSFFVVIIGVAFYKAKPTVFQLIGLGLGSTGLFLVLNSQADIASNPDIRYALFLFPATVGYAVSLTTIKFKLNHLPSMAITSLSFFLVLVPALLIAIITDAFSPIFNHVDGFKAIGYLSILAVLGTAIAVMLFTKLVAISNHIFSSAIAYILPVVAIFIGVLDGEVFPLVNLFWVTLIIAGVFLMNRSTKKKAENSPQNIVKDV
jgi:drug/metabolite transporter (DMT)-like permease